MNVPIRSMHSSILQDAMLRTVTLSVLCPRKIIPAVFFFLTALTPLATASVATFGPTNQNITLTGMGVNAAGNGQDRVTWGACVYSGSTTVCTVTAPFTGVGVGGTISFILTYPGNGPSPLATASQSPGNDVLVPFFFLSSGSFVTTLTESDGTTLTFNGEAPYFFYNQPGDQVAQCSGVSTCSAGQIGFTVGATMSGQISGSFDPTPVIRSSLGVISASAYGAFPSIAPGTWVEIYGSNLETNPQARIWGGADFTGINAPTTLGGTTVTIGGRLAFIDYVSPTQVNAQVPSDVPPEPQPVVVTTAGGSSAAYTVQVNPIQPGLLAPPAFQLNGNQYIVALYPDGVTYVLPPGITNAVPTRLTKPGDTIVLYGVGFGPVTPNTPAGQIVQQANTLQSPIQVFFAGTPARVTYNGLTPTFVGLYQFNVVVPNVAASNAVPLTFSVGSTTGSQNMVIAVGN